jgi:hypothetical protein
MSDEQTPDPNLQGAGLSATGKTADQFSPGDESAGTTYGDPGGTATAEEESTQAEPSAEAGQDASGDTEGKPQQ